MAAHRFPILVWQDQAGGFTACSIDEVIEASAVADSYSEAVAQVKEYLQWHYARNSWYPGPDFHEARLLALKVQIRPEYQVEMSRAEYGKSRSRTYSCPETVALRVHCVLGRDSGGLALCAIPTLGLRFTYSKEDALRELVTYSVQGRLKGMTPQQVARFLAPAQVVLDEVIVSVPREAKQLHVAPEELEQLATIAEPLGVKGFRRQLSRPWERDEQVSRLVIALGKERASVILVGEAGTGKTAVLAEAVRKVERDPGKASAEEDEDQPQRPRQRFWLTSAARLIAGMQYLGQWQERAESVIAALTGIGGTLCVENLLELVRVGGVGPGDSLAAFLMPYLGRGELMLVGEATPAELDACRRLLPGFVDLFQIHVIPQLTRQQTVSALTKLADSHRQQLHLDVEPAAVELTVRLFARFMPYHSFPGRAAGFLMQVMDRAHREREPSVTHRHVIEQLVRQTGLPEGLLRDDVPLARDEVLSELQRQVIGQPRACEAAADLIVTFKAGLNDPNRPIGVLLFCGPTGVGKTELAKAVSRYLFGHGESADRLVRVDMSEYSGGGAAERFLGDARGEPSALVRAVRQQPFSVVLLDEIEKAAPEIFDLLLGVFDEGRLTDAYGRLTTFRSTILIMTSNLGADRLGGFGLGRAAGGAVSYDDEAMRFFRPEFYNRIDAVIAFDPLDDESIRRITEKELAEIAQREGFLRANLKIQWTEPLVAHLARRGFDRRYGARPLQRTIESLVVVPLSRFLLHHPHMKNATLALDLDPANNIVIERT